MQNTVSVDNLVKVYQKNVPPAVNGLSFDVRHGEVFGLLGPNGAGKTTTIGVLTTRVMPTSGRATINGVDVLRDSRHARQLLAVVPQHNNLDRALTSRQNLLFHAAYHGVGRAERTKRANEVLRWMGLAEQANSRVDRVSGGQAQRIMIARALMHRPAVMFLDEPTTGLDPQARLFVHDRIAALRDERVTVVLSTHDMDEVEKLCDRVGIIDHGKLLAIDTPSALMKGLRGSTTLTIVVSGSGVESDRITTALSGIEEVEWVEVVRAAAAMYMPPNMGGGMGGMPSGMGPGFPLPPGIGMPSAGIATGVERRHFRLYLSRQPSAVLPRVLRALDVLGVELSDMSISTPSLEDVFIHLTGRELR